MDFTLPSAKQSFLYGAKTFEFTCQTTATLYLCCRTENDNPFTLGDIPVKVVLHREGNELDTVVSVHNHAHLIGVAELNFTCGLPGDYKLRISMAGRPLTLESSEISVKILNKFNIGLQVEQKKLDPIKSKRKKLNVGVQVEQNFGDMRTPWGICSRSNGHIYVSDRCESRSNICVFDHNFKLIRKFGQSGRWEGQFQNPCGIKFDKNDRLVVCDKDNHRIQVFDVRVFASKKSKIIVKFSFLLEFAKNPMFSSPWDVAVTESNQYLVTYAENNICVFASNLKSFTKIDYAPSYPSVALRWVCSGHLGEMLFTDFDNGEVMGLNADTLVPYLKLKPSWLENGEQPIKTIQGIFVDDNGYILIAVSNNNVIEIYTYGGYFVKEIPLPGECFNIVQMVKKCPTYVVLIKGIETNTICVVTAEISVENLVHTSLSSGSDVGNRFRTRSCSAATLESEIFVADSPRSSARQLSDISSHLDSLSDSCKKKQGSLLSGSYKKKQGSLLADSYKKKQRSFSI